MGRARESGTESPVTDKAIIPSSQGGVAWLNFATFPVRPLPRC